MGEDWIEIGIGNVANLYQPKTISAKMLITDGNYPVYGANGIIGKYDKYNHEEEELLITCRGATSGNVHITQPFSWINGNAMVVKPFDKELLSLEFLRLVFSSKGRTQKAISGSAQPQITRTTLSPIQIPLAPLPIQRAIVTKIENLFTSLDKGIAHLKKAQEQLKIYRQAVLKKAFEGELTKEWREKQTNLPTVDELLEQIKEERQKHYEQQVEEWKQAVNTWVKNEKEGKKPSRISKPKDSPGVQRGDVENYDTLPKSWKWSRFGNVTYKIGDIDHKMPKTVENGMPYLSTGNINNDGTIDFDGAKLISKLDFDRLALKIKPEKGDIIFPRYGTIGRNILIDFDREFLVSYSCAIIKNITKLMDEKFALYYSLSPVIKKEIKRYTVETTQANIGIASIESFVFPLCTKKEQNQIVREIESRLSVCDKVEQNITEALDKSEALRQSILKKAFEGKLLSETEIEKCKQEADYEPASELLKKIKGAETKNPPKKTEKNKYATTKISKDIQAGIIAKVIKVHEDNPKHLQKLNHIKCEKIAHAVEYHLKIALGRKPTKDAAGPDDYPHLQKVEHRAKFAGYFSTKDCYIDGWGKGHTYVSGRNINKAINNLENKLTPKQKLELDKLIGLFLKFELEHAELIATVYAGWNNLLIDGIQPTDEEIVFESRENWSSRKLKIDREKFFRTLNWMRKPEVALIPQGFGLRVNKSEKKLKTNGKVS